MKSHILLYFLKSVAFIILTDCIFRLIPLSTLPKTSPQKKTLPYYVPAKETLHRIHLHVLKFLFLKWHHGQQQQHMRVWDDRPPCGPPLCRHPSEWTLSVPSPVGEAHRWNHFCGPFSSISQNRERGWTVVLNQNTDCHRYLWKKNEIRTCMEKVHLGKAGF